MIPKSCICLWSSLSDSSLALPQPKQRAAVTLRFTLDLRYAELGSVIGCSEDAARRNVHEGLRKLKEVVIP